MPHLGRLIARESEYCTHPCCWTAECGLDFSPQPDVPAQQEWQHLSNRNERRCGGGEDKDVDIAVIITTGCCGAQKEEE